VSDNDTLIVTFTYSGGQNDPSGYTINAGANTEIFTITYDNQGRVLRDTTIPDYSGDASTYSYPANNFVYTSTDNESSDTFYMSSNNIARIAQATVPFDPTAYDLTSFTYSPQYANPFYYTGQDRNVRLLLSKIDGWEIFFNDCISQNIATRVHDSNGLDEPISYSTDSQGRVTKASTFAGVITYFYTYR
jgi:hypothetical protein